jgi:hypothetical protein
MDNNPKKEKQKKITPVNSMTRDDLEKNILLAILSLCVLHPLRFDTWDCLSCIQPLVLF